MLVLEQLSKTYAGARSRSVLRGVELELGAGEYIAVMGESGIGKSTLLNLIAGLDRPDAGSIRLDGVDLAGLADDALTDLRRASMGFVFQAFHILPYLSLAQNVALPLILNHVAEEEAAARRRDARRGRLRRPRRRACRANCPAVSCSASRLRAHWCIAPSCCSPTSRPAISTRRARPRCWRCCANRSRRSNAGCILVTHSQAAAATADRIMILTAQGLREAKLMPAAGRARLCRQRRCSSRRWRSIRGRLAVSVLAIALGVALGYAVQLINAVALNEFSQAVRSIAGEADLEIHGPRAGFDEDALSAHRAPAQVAVASPVLDANVKLPGGRSAARAGRGRVSRSAGATGADRRRAHRRARAAARGCAVSQSGRSRLAGVQAGDRLVVQVGLTEVSLRVAGLLRGNGRERLGVMDIAAAQRVLQRMGRINRLDLRAPGRGPLALCRRAFRPSCRPV